MKALKCKERFPLMFHSKVWSWFFFSIFLCKQPPACGGSDWTCLQKGKSWVQSSLQWGLSALPPLSSSERSLWARATAEGLLLVSCCWVMLPSALCQGHEVSDTAQDARDHCAWEWQSQPALSWNCLTKYRDFIFWKSSQARHPHHLSKHLNSCLTLQSLTYVFLHFYIVLQRAIKCWLMPWLLFTEFKKII